MVSVDEKNNILGYLHSKLDRTSNKVSSVSAIRFSDPSPIFREDFDTFFKDMFEKFNFNKIEWCVGIGNPAEKKYDNIINIYGGRAVGVQYESTVLMDGTYCDIKEYEIFKRDYLAHKEAMTK